MNTACQSKQFGAFHKSLVLAKGQVLRYCVFDVVVKMLSKPALHTKQESKKARKKERMDSHRQSSLHQSGQGLERSHARV